MATDLRSPPDADFHNPSDVSRVRISRKMLAAMIEAGVVHEGDRVQLIDGELFQMAAMNDPHWTVLTHLVNILPRTVPIEWSITCQSPVVVDEFGEPEPDIAVFRGSAHARKAKPTATETALVIEVADTSLDFDRGLKQWAYAEAGIPEYWILDINEKVVEVRSDPQPRSGKTRGTYAVLHEYRGDEKVPLRLAGRTIAEFAVTELIPL